MEIKNLTKCYRKKVVFDKQDFDFSNKGIYYIKGESGIGKTTLLNILSGLDLKYSGDFYFKGKKIKRKAKAFDRFRRDNIGFSFQQNIFMPKQTVKQNLDVVLSLSNYNKTKKEELIDKALETLGIKDLKNKRMGQISGGQKQRVNFARAIVNDPKILIVDEPTASLDKDNKIIILNILKQLSKNKTIIIVSHDKIVEEYADIIIELTDKENNAVVVNVTEQNKFENNNENKRKKSSILNNLKIGFRLIKNKTLLFPIMLIIVGFLTIAMLSLSFLYNGYLTKIDNYSTNIHDDVMIITNSCSYEETVNYYDVPQKICTDAENGEYPIKDAGLEYLQTSPYVENYYFNPWYFTGSKTDNQDVYIGTSTELEINFNPEESEAIYNFVEFDSPIIVDLPVSKNSYGGSSNTNYYPPSMKMLPVDGLADNEQYNANIEEALLFGEMPTKPNEAVIPSTFAKYQYNTDNFETAIGQTFTNCSTLSTTSGYENVTQDLDTKCQEYVVTGVYQESAVVGDDIYVPYSEWFATSYFPEVMAPMSYSFVVDLDSPEHKDEFINEYIAAANPGSMQVTDTDTNLYMNREALINTVKSFIMLTFFIAVGACLIVGSIYRIRFKHQIKTFALLRSFGYSKWNLTLVIIAESIIIVLISTVIAVIIATTCGYLANQAFIISQMSSKNFTVEEVMALYRMPFSFDAPIFILMVSIVIVTAIAMALWNIIFLYRKNLIETMRRK